MPLHAKVQHVEDDDDDDGPNIQEVIEKQPEDFAWWDKKVGRGGLQLCSASSPILSSRDDEGANGFMMCDFDLGGGKVSHWESEKTILDHQLEKTVD